MLSDFSKQGAEVSFPLLSALICLLLVCATAMNSPNRSKMESKTLCVRGINTVTGKEQTNRYHESV